MNFQSSWNTFKGVFYGVDIDLTATGTTQRGNSLDNELWAMMNVKNFKMKTKKETMLAPKHK